MDFFIKFWKQWKLFSDIFKDTYLQTNLFFFIIIKPSIKFNNQYSIDVMLLDYRIYPSVSVRTSSKQFWMCWLQMMFVFWQRVKMSSVVVGNLSEFSHRHRHLATFASLRVRGTSTSCWTSGSRNTGATGWKVFVFFKFNSENWLWKDKYLWSSLSFVYISVSQRVVRGRHVTNHVLKFQVLIF